MWSSAIQKLMHGSLFTPPNPANYDLTHKDLIFMPTEDLVDKLIL